MDELEMQYRYYECVIRLHEIEWEQRISEMRSCPNRYNEEEIEAVIKIWNDYLEEKRGNGKNYIKGEHGRFAGSKPAGGSGNATIYLLTESNNYAIINKKVFNTKNDPMREAMGSAEESHANEIEKLKQHIYSLGGTLERPDEERLAYEPSPNPGKPGKVIISKGASYSAWLHEVKHFDDDYNDGFLGFRVFIDAEKSARREIDAYAIEISLAMSIDRMDIVKRLEVLRDEEVRQYKRDNQTDEQW